MPFLRRSHISSTLVQQSCFDRVRTYGAGQLSLSWLGLTDGRCCLDDGERDARVLSHSARQLSAVERSARACTLLEVSAPAALASLHRLILSSPSGLTPSSCSTLSFRTGAFFCFAGSDRRCTLAVGMDSWARSGPSRDVFSSVGGQPPDASLCAPTPGFGALPRRLEQVGSHVDRVGRRLERGAASARARGQVRATRETGPCTVHLPSPGPGGPTSNGSGSARRACVRSTGCFERRGSGAPALSATRRGRNSDGDPCSRWLQLPRRAHAIEQHSPTLSGEHERARGEGKAPSSVRRREGRAGSTTALVAGERRSQKSARTYAPPASIASVRGA